MSGPNPLNAAVEGVRALGERVAALEAKLEATNASTSLALQAICDVLHLLCEQKFVGRSRADRERMDAALQRIQKFVKTQEEDR